MQFWKICLDHAYIRAPDESAAWSEATRIVNNIGSSDFSLVETTHEKIAIENAAPELYAACKEALEFLDGFAEDLQTENLNSDLRERLRATVKKAERK